MKERLIRFLTSKQLSAAQFADEIGVQRSSISHILSGRNKPSFDFIEKMLRKYPGLNPEWLILGKGNMYREMVQKTIFDAIDANESKKSVYNETKNKDLPLVGQEKITGIINNQADKIEKIVIFYKDNTFKEYNSRG